MTELTGIVRVVDGDTLRVGGQPVRLHGIDAPETSQDCGTLNIAWACGAWSTETLRALAEGRQATCTVTQGRDRYDRWVATCAVDGDDLGHRMVSLGAALAFRKYSLDYDLTEKRAAVAGRGLHGSRFDRPAVWRETRRAEADAQHLKTAPEGCMIKGNISRNGGQQIYHVPGQRHYDATRINRASGERWFCSEHQARAAGWRRARR